MAYSFSGTAGNRAEGSLTIHDPPMPSGRNGQAPGRFYGREFELDARQREPQSITADLGFLFHRSHCRYREARASPSAGRIVIAPGRSLPKTHSRKNSRLGFTLARLAR